MFARPSPTRCLLLGGHTGGGNGPVRPPWNRFAGPWLVDTMIAKRSLLLALLWAAPSLAGAQPAVIAADEIHARLVAGKKAVLVDVRTPWEYAQVHIVGAIGIPADRIRAEAARLPRDLSTTLIFYCRGAG